LIKLRDHYFISWLNVEKGIPYVINNNEIMVGMSTKEYYEYLKEYENSAKPLLKKIREIVKELNNSNK